MAGLAWGIGPFLRPDAGGPGTGATRAAALPDRGCRVDVGLWRRGGARTGGRGGREATGPRKRGPSRGARRSPAGTGAARAPTDELERAPGPVGGATCAWRKGVGLGATRPGRGHRRGPGGDPGYPPVPPVSSSPDGAEGAAYREAVPAATGLGRPSPAPRRRVPWLTGPASLCID